MFEIFFLSAIALIWIIFATFQDIKSREIANWLNFSLIAFAIGFRFFYSLFSLGNFNFFYQGILGLGIFLILGNVLYYGRFFAGGDAKLLISLGAVLSFSESFYNNVQNFSFFLLIFLLVGALYSIIISGVLCLKNYKKFKKEFGKQFLKNKKAVNVAIFISLIFIILGFYENLLFYLGIFTFLVPYLYFYAKAVDEVSMIKNQETSKLREGDWLYRDVKVKGRTIKAKWDGLKKEEITLLRREKRKIMIREGIPFTPVFLFSFIIFLYLWNKGLWYSFW